MNKQQVYNSILSNRTYSPLEKVELIYQEILSWEAANGDLETKLEEEYEANKWKYRAARKLGLGEFF